MFQVEKIQQELKIIGIQKSAPKNKIRLSPLDPQDYLIDLQSVSLWSPNNIILYHKLLENGMCQFLCNQQFLLNFYTQLNFPSANIATLCPQFTGLKTLDLTDNKIITLQHLPPALQQLIIYSRELYVDFNLISKVNIAVNKLVLLSASHNKIDDECYKEMMVKTPELRCLNVSYNELDSLQHFVKHLPKKMKILTAFMNSFSILPMYYQYVTSRVELKYFDGEPFTKEEIKKEVKQEVKQVVEIEAKAEKNGKLDMKNAKNVKEEKKQVVEQLQNRQKEQEKNEIILEKFHQFTLEIKICNIQNIKGIVFDPNLLPENALFQSQYQIKCVVFGKQIASTVANYQNFFIENEEGAFTFNYIIRETISKQEWKQINAGAMIYLLKKEPKTILDQNGELKPIAEVDQSIIGGVFVDLRKLHHLPKKQFANKFKLFEANVIKHPLFINPLLDEQKLIQKQKKAFEDKLAKAQKQKKQQQQAQENARNMKKKDSKKAPQKKAAKKQGKQPIIQKQANEKNNFSFDPKTYCNFGRHQMYKCRNEVICVAVKIS